MRRGRAAALLLCLAAAHEASAADLAYPGPTGGPAEKAAESLRGASAERLAPLATAADVLAAVRSGAASAGVLPDDVAAEALLAALDPGLRIVREAEQGDGSWWAIEKAAGKADDHPDHVAVNLESERGAKALSDVVAGLQRLGFWVEQIVQVRLPGRGSEGRPMMRQLIVFASERPLLLLRVTDVLARDVRMGDGHARLVGAWRQAGEALR